MITSLSLWETLDGILEFFWMHLAADSQLNGHLFSIHLCSSTLMNAFVWLNSSNVQPCDLYVVLEPIPYQPLKNQPKPHESSSASSQNRLATEIVQKSPAAARNRSRSRSGK
ncbi:hypothetical protein TNIN_118441 [Trichonephila inaurata madagascariensis]|uniref:Uncharacterized protein n=1 Tax=Trichonephila inaurata madagascariensis TaxID=2747483 RepID=A0A8X6IIC5_9ARAC|nr:hypothetical protein TNIN_118441 [Trichonephila inaurata madagascariensis]